MQQNHRLIWIIGLLAIYALCGIVILGIGQHRTTRAVQFHTLLEETQPNWQEQLLQAQMLHSALIRGLKAPDAEQRLAELQKTQAHRLHQLTRLTVGLASDRLSQGIEHLDAYDRQFRDALTNYIESREDQLSIHNAELVQLTVQQSQLLEELAPATGASSARHPWIFWLWLIPLLTGGAIAAWHLLARQQRQIQTLQNYLDLPITQLLEPPENLHGNRRFADQDADRELEAKVELLLQHIQEEVQARENFTATMSHEIRTPMNGLIGFLSTLKATQLNDQQRQYLRIIDSSARSLMHVINEILDFTKLRAGRLALEEIAFDLRAFADERTALARQAARGKSLKVHLNFPGEGPVIIRTDPSRLRQVLDNLLSNAVKFTDRGEVILEVTATPDPSSANRLILAFSVRDSGIGMTQTEQNRVFKPYIQADTSIARRYGGTGLGLYISYSLVELLGGKLQLQSRPGEGSTFSFSFTCDRAKPEEQVYFSDLYHVRLPRAELKKHWALLVDDTPTNLFLLETICQGTGLPYMTAQNGQ